MKKCIRVLIASVLALAMASSAIAATTTASTKKTATTSNAATAASTTTEAKTAPAITEKKVNIKNGDHAIPGVLTLPAGDSKTKTPAVLLLHGTGSNKDEVGNQYVNLAKEMANAGIASLRIDFAGTGDSKQDYSKYTISDAVSDSEVALKYLSKLGSVDSKRVGVVGYSQGGLIAIGLASKNSSVKALCTWAGAPSMADAVTNKDGGYNAVYEAAKKSKTGYAEYDMGFIKLNFSLKWFEEALETDGLKDIASYKGALLAINGNKDTSVSHENAFKIVEASGSTDAQVLIVKDADHLFGALDETPNPLTKELRDSTIAWFLRKL